MGSWQLSFTNCGSKITHNMGKLQLKVRGEKLPNMDLFSKSDPYLCVYIARDNEEEDHFINRTEVKKDDLNPKWEELLLDHEDINQHNLQAKIKLEVLDYDGRGKPAEYMCCNQFSLAALQEACQGSSKLELRNKIKQKKGKSYGYIYIETFNISD